MATIGRAVSCALFRPVDKVSSSYAPAALEPINITLILA